MENIKNIAQLLNNAKKLIQSKQKLQEEEYIKCLEDSIIELQRTINQQPFSFIRDSKNKPDGKISFEDLADHLQDGYWIEENGRLVYCNRKMEELFSIRRKKDYDKYFSIFDKVYVSKLDQSNMDNAGSNELNFNCGIIDKNGNHRHLDIKVVPVFNKLSNSVQSIGIVQDITETSQNELFLKETKDAAERKNRELEFLNQLVESVEKKYKKLFMDMASGFALHEMIYDHQGNAEDFIFIEVNNAFEKITNLKREHIIGRSAREIFPGIEKYWLDAYEYTVKTKRSAVLENYFSPLKKYFSVTVYTPGKHLFATILTDISDRKEKEYLLRVNEQKFKHILDFLPIAVAIINLSGDIEQVNQYFTQLFGYTLDQIGTIKKWSLQAYPNKNYLVTAIETWTRENRQSLHQDSKTSTWVTKVLDKEGKTLNIEMTFRLIEGKILATFVNLTERINFEHDLKSLNGELQKINKKLIQSNKEIFKTNNELREAEERYRTVLDTMADGVLVINARGEFITCNKASEEILGFDKNEYIGTTKIRKTWKFFNDKGIELGKESFPDIITFQSGNPINNSVLEIRLPGRQPKYVSVNTRPLYENFSLKPTQVILSFTDITSKTQTERALKSNEKIISSFQEIILGTIGEKFFETIVVALANTLKATITLVGKFEKDNQLLFKSISVYKDEAIVDNYEFNIQDTPFALMLKGKSSSYMNNLELSYPESSFIKENRLKAFVGIPLFDSKGIVTGVLAALFRDPLENLIFYETILRIFAEKTGAEIERLEYEKELKIAKLKAEDSDRLKTAFLANMSHEIRTPMNGILGFANLLENEKLTREKRHRYVEIINSSAKQLLTIISDILDVSRIEAGLLEIRGDDIQLFNLLNDIKSEFILEIHNRKKTNIVLRTKMPGNSKNQLIHTDEIRLKQVISNLVSNSIKFTNEGFIEFGYRYHDKNTLLFFVTDTGIGISPEYHKIIFERFRQVENVKLISGTGLGLSISKALITLLGGKIWIESEPGSGTTFYFTIPIKKTSDLKN